MDPVIGGAILGGVFDLFGAKRAEKREAAAIAAQNAYNDPSAVRARYEKAGLNPLLAFNAGPVGLQTAVGGSSFMGSAVADFVQSVAGAMTSRALAKEDSKNKAVQRKASAEQKLTRMALRPKVAGPMEIARANGGTAAALGLVPVNGGSSAALLPYTGAGPAGSPLMGGEPQSTRTNFGEPDKSSTSFPEGGDLEDAVTGVAIEGLNELKDEGKIPQDAENVMWGTGKMLSKKAIMLGWNAIKASGAAQDYLYGHWVRGSSEKDFQAEEARKRAWRAKNPSVPYRQSFVLQ